MWSVLILVSILLGEKARKKNSVSVCKGYGPELHILTAVAGRRVPVIDIPRWALLQTLLVVTIHQVKCKQKRTSRQNRPKLMNCFCLTTYYLYVWAMEGCPEARASTGGL